MKLPDADNISRIKTRTYTVILLVIDSHLIYSSCITNTTCICIFLAHRVVDASPFILISYESVEPPVAHLPFVLYKFDDLYSFMYIKTNSR